MTKEETEEEEIREECQEQLLQQLEIARSYAESGEYVEGFIVLINDEGHVMLTTPSSDVRARIGILEQLKMTDIVRALGLVTDGSTYHE